MGVKIIPHVKEKKGTPTLIDRVSLLGGHTLTKRGKENPEGLLEKIIATRYEQGAKSLHMK